MTGGGAVLCWYIPDFYHLCASCVQVVVGIASHKVLVYDTAMGRRPQLEVAWGDTRITSLAPQPGGESRRGGEGERAGAGVQVVVPGLALVPASVVSLFACAAGVWLGSFPACTSGGAIKGIEPLPIRDRRSRQERCKI